MKNDLALLLIAFDFDWAYQMSYRIDNNLYAYCTLYIICLMYCVTMWMEWSEQKKNKQTKTEEKQKKKSEWTRILYETISNLQVPRFFVHLFSRYGMRMALCLFEWMVELYFSLVSLLCFFPLWSENYEHFSHSIPHLPFSFCRFHICRSFRRFNEISIGPESHFL